jgi:pimeloyl-ACP methyl ester carboxylesterase
MKRGYVDTPHGQIHYRIEQPPAGGSDETPVVVLHNTPSSSEAMAPLLRELGKEVTAIGMDTIGYGQSDRPPQPYTTMHEFAQAVAWFIQGLGYDRVRLYGDQTGSQIALQTAADFPELVESIAVFDAFNWGTPERRAVHERLHRYYPRDEEGSHLMKLWERTGRRGDLKQREMSFRNRLTVNDDTGAEVYGHMGWEGAGPYCMCRQDIWSVTPRIQAPAFIMYAPGSELHRALERFLETLPRGRGTREAPNVRTDPAAGARALIDFYRSPGV